MKNRGRYFKGEDGRRYCYGLQPAFRCPNATTSSDDEEHQLERVSVAAGALGADAGWLAELLRRAHTGAGGARHRAPGGAITSDCAICRRRLRRLGFACWIEAPIGPGSSRGRIAARLGARGWQRVDGPWYRDRKTEAREWARSRAEGAST
jgi:hypothetical protein